jgi:hypothetical protein
MIIGPAARIAAAADPTRLPSIRAAIVDALEPHESPRGVWLEAATYVVSGRA